MLRIGERVAKAALGVAFLALLACSDGGGADAIPFPDNVDAVEAQESPDIDIGQYELTFKDEFRRKPSVSAWDCNTKWIAHTPWKGDFGAARFSDPEKGFPFQVRNGLLRIEARKDAEWRSGLLSAWNSCDRGFAQQYGYFEIRAMLPRGDGFWPAFWLVGVNRDQYTAEIDVFEYHSIRPGRFSTTVHVHPRADNVERVLDNELHAIEPGLLSRGFNTFGLDIDEDDIVFYFNRKEIWRLPTSEEFKQPLFPLLNLAMVEREMSVATPERAFMYVDYVRVYRRKDAVSE